MPNEKILYSVPEAADALGVKPSTVLTYVKRGRLVAVRLSDNKYSRLRITADALEAFVHSRAPAR